MIRIQGQTTSGPNSLIQRSLLGVSSDLTAQYLAPVKKHLRENARILRNTYREHNLESLWYQSTSAFYYLIDFSRTPIIKKYSSSGKEACKDYSNQICEDLLKNYGIVTSPGSAFGAPNTVRINLAIEKNPFEEAIKKIVQFMCD